MTNRISETNNALYFQTQLERYLSNLNTTIATHAEKRRMEAIEKKAFEARIEAAYANIERIQVCLEQRSREREKILKQFYRLIGKIGGVDPNALEIKISREAEKAAAEKEEELIKEQQEREGLLPSFVTNPDNMFAEDRAVTEKTRSHIRAAIIEDNIRRISQCLSDESFLEGVKCNIQKLKEHVAQVKQKSVLYHLKSPILYIKNQLQKKQDLTNKIEWICYLLLRSYLAFDVIIINRLNNSFEKFIYINNYLEKSIYDSHSAVSKGDILSKRINAFDKTNQRFEAYTYMFKYLLPTTSLHKLKKMFPPQNTYLYVKPAEALNFRGQQAGLKELGASKVQEEETSSATLLLS